VGIRPDLLKRLFLLSGCVFDYDRPQSRGPYTLGDVENGRARCGS